MAILARRWGQITTVGMLLDPIADKLLISAALVSLVANPPRARLDGGFDHRPRIAVTGLRSIAAAEGYTIHASDLAKNENDHASDRHFDGTPEHSMGAIDWFRHAVDVGRGRVRHGVRHRLLPEVLAQGG